MFITEHEDGTVTYTGSFNRAEWDEFMANRGAQAATDEVTVPEAEVAPEPAGNASADEWRSYAVSLGASEEDVADLSRNELREQYGATKDGE